MSLGNTSNPVSRASAPSGPRIQIDDSTQFEWNIYQLAIPELHQDLIDIRILHVSDLHALDHWRAAYDHFRAQLAERPIDLILCTGDYVEDKFNSSPAIPVAQRFARLLDAPLDAYGVRGNHDLQITSDHFKPTPLTLIDGQRMLLDVRGAKLELIGIPGPERETLNDDFINSLPPKQAGVCRIVLSHFPDNIQRLTQIQPDIFLCGHTHGGQICLPGGIPIIRHDSLPRKFCRGVHRFDNTWLVVNRGLGFTTIPMRLFCPAEVIEIQLVAVQ